MWKDINKADKTPEGVVTSSGTENAPRSITTSAGAEKASGSITTYREAVEEFSTNASEFLKSVPTLIKTRDAYQRAMSISAEVRKLLDTGDEKLRAVMKQIEEAFNVQFAKQPDKKRPEVSTPELFRTGTSTPPDVLSILAHDFEKKLKED
jgi:hypothetical protein